METTTQKTTENQILSGHLFNDPYARSQEWLFFELETKRPFKIVESQTERLNKKVTFFNTIENFYGKIYKAKKISENIVEVILD